MTVLEKDLAEKNLLLKEELEEYKDLVEGIRNGGVDALAINKDGHANIFSLESSDFVYRVLVENFPEGALNLSDKGVIVYANPAFERLLGSNNSSIMGLDFISIVEKQSKWVFEKLFRNAFSGNSTGEIVIDFRQKQVCVEISLSSLYPRFHGIGILIKDLSEKRKKEDQLIGYKKLLLDQEKQLLETKIAQGSIDKFRFMGDTVPQKVWTAEPSGALNYFNKKWFEYSFLSAEELKGMGWLKMIHPEDRDETERAWKHSVESGAVYETEHRFENHKGIYRWHLSRAAAQHDETGNIIMWVGTTTDVHEQRNFTIELERRVDEARVFLKSIFDSSEELIASLDLDFNVTSINKIGADLFAVETEKIVGNSLFSFLPELLDGTYQKLLESVLEGKVVHQTETVNLEAREVVFDAYFKPLIINKKVTGIVVVARDITQITSMTRNLQQTKKQLELQYKKIEQKNKKLLESNAELVSFNYIASHDLQEPLRKILMFSARIDKQRSELSVASRLDLDRICAAASHMKNLLEALLSYSEISHEKHRFEKCDLNHLLNTVRSRIMDSHASRNPTILFQDLPVLEIIPYQIEQLFTNLITNAIKYSRNDLIPRIEISAELLNADGVSGEELLGSPRWRICVSDNGIGFEQKYESKIFDLFQRLHTKETFEGTGIGLAICKKVVQNHNGIILANSIPDEGSAFMIYLPETQPTLTAFEELEE
jgi:PAS domain S-box-containing protein